MSDPVYPAPGGNQIPPDNDQTELLHFLSEESRKNRDTLWELTEANRRSLNDQAEADRRLLRNTLWIVSVPLTIVLAVAGWFGFKDLNAIEHQAQTTLAATVEQNKAEAALERQESKEALNEIRSEAKATGQAEIQRADRALQAKFSDENIQRTIDNAAKTATEGKAGALIEQRVQERMDPLVAQAQASADALQVLELIAKASNADDAEAFDELLLLGNKGSSEQQVEITKVIANLHTNARENLAIGENGTCGQYHAAFHEELDRPDRASRKRAIASCDPLVTIDNSGINSPDKSEKAVPEMEHVASEIVGIALHDHSLSVRAQAINTINLWFRAVPGIPPDGFDLIDNSGLSKWWKENQSNMTFLLLLSRARYFRQQDWSSVAIYDEVKKVANNAPAPLQNAFSKTLDTLRSDAVKPEDITRWAKDRSCSGVAKELEEALPKWSQELRWSSGRSEFEFLDTCPIDKKLLPKVTEYAATTKNLRVRYWAVMVINKWTGAGLDPFDTRKIQDWWEKNKAAYQQ